MLQWISYFNFLFGFFFFEMVFNNIFVSLLIGSLNYNFVLNQG